MCFIKVGDLSGYMKAEDKKILSKQKKKEVVKSVLNRNSLGNRVINIINNVYCSK